MTIPNSYRDSLSSTILLTGIIVVLSALVTDFGETLRINLIAVLLYWGWIFVSMYRRPEKLTTLDFWLIRWGIFPFVICFWTVVQAVWRLRSLS